MNKYYCLLLLPFCLLVSCSEQIKIPDGILDRESMANALWDTFLADSWAQQVAQKDSTIELSDEVKALSAEAFSLNHLTEDEFFRSYNWYREHPEILNEILDSLSSRKSDMNRAQRLEPDRNKRIKSSPVLKRKKPSDAQ